MGAQLDLVYLSSASLEHILEKHGDVEMLDLLVLPKLLETGLWIGDRPNTCSIAFQHPDDGNRYISAIKSAADGYEHYITTFHRCGKRQTKSLLKRGPVLRKHL
ncbi:hypothetical protein [Hoeflea sp. TYP-13]|uniref:hypothetical protein n=1 Tax=Hoeflea sp. TYP-13 TaxID=3230023 RepID=UPI0034C68C4E